MSKQQSQWLGISQLRRSTIIVFLALTLFSAVTHAQPAKEVIVINDSTNPVPVTTNGFPRTPFAIQLVGTWIPPPTPGDTECQVSFNVQNEQLLVIEGITIAEPSRFTIRGTQITVVTNTVPVTHSYARDGDAGGATSHQLRLYADAGSPVDLLVTSSLVLNEPCTVSVSGYLISPESPSLAP